MQKLNQIQISQNLKQLINWQLQESKTSTPEEENLLIIKKTFAFADYMSGIEFVHKVALQAEKANHHPKLIIDWCKVTIELFTHDVSGLTQKDFDLAQEIEKLA